MQKTDGEYRPFYHTFLTKERNIQKSACAAPRQKVNPRFKQVGAGSWRVELPENQALSIATNHGSRIHIVDSA